MAILGFLLCVLLGWLILHFAFKIHWALGVGLIIFGFVYMIIDFIIKLN